MDRYFLSLTILVTDSSLRFLPCLQMLQNVKTVLDSAVAFQTTKKKTGQPCTIHLVHETYFAFDM